MQETSFSTPEETEMPSEFPAHLQGLFQMSEISRLFKIELDLIRALDATHARRRRLAAAEFLSQKTK